MLAGCDWWISIRSVDNMHDWRKFWKRFRGCFVFESRVSTKTVVINISLSKVQALCQWLSILNFLTLANNLRLKYVRLSLIYTTFVAWKYWFKLTDFRCFLALYSSVFFLCDLNRTIIGLGPLLFPGPIRWQTLILEGEMCSLTTFPSLTTFSGISSSAVSAIPWISKLCFLVHCSTSSSWVIAVPRSS